MHIPTYSHTTATRQDTMERLHPAVHRLHLAVQRCNLQSCRDIVRVRGKELVTAQSPTYIDGWNANLMLLTEQLGSSREDAKLTPTLAEVMEGVDASGLAEASAEQPRAPQAPPPLLLDLSDLDF
eukprot:m.195789 g.195789  ORF g.195789 m.195789 type:complete len:125 (+) comp53731_c0_seq4:268-642(+)